MVSQIVELDAPADGLLETQRSSVDPDGHALRRAHAGRERARAQRCAP